MKAFELRRENPATLAGGRGAGATEEDSMATVKSAPTSNVSAQDYEPFVHEGERFGDVHWLRVGSGGEGMLYSGLWTHEPASFPYSVPGDETFDPLEGA